MELLTQSDVLFADSRGQTHRKDLTYGDAYFRADEGDPVSSWKARIELNIVLAGIASKIDRQDTESWKCQFGCHERWESSTQPKVLALYPLLYI